VLRTQALEPDGLASKPDQRSKSAKAMGFLTPNLSSSVTLANYATSLTFGFFICNLGRITASSLPAIILSVNEHYWHPRVLIRIHRLEHGKCSADFLAPHRHCLNQASGAQARLLSSYGNLDKPGAFATSSVEWEHKLPLPFGGHAA